MAEISENMSESRRVWLGLASGDPEFLLFVFLWCVTKHCCHLIGTLCTL